MELTDRSRVQIKEENESIMGFFISDFINSQIKTAIVRSRVKILRRCYEIGEMGLVAILIDSGRNAFSVRNIICITLDKD